MNLRLPGLDLLPPPQGERWISNVLERIKHHFGLVLAQMNFLTMDPQARVSGTDPLGALVASESLTLTSSIQVIRSPAPAAGPVLEIKYLYPPAGQATMRGIVHLILTHDGTTNYKLARESSGVGNLKLQGLTLSVSSSNSQRAVSLIYDGEFWYPMAGQAGL